MFAEYGGVALTTLVAISDLRTASLVLQVHEKRWFVEYTNLFVRLSSPQTLCLFFSAFPLPSPSPSTLKTRSRHGMRCIQCQLVAMGLRVCV